VRTPLSPLLEASDKRPVSELARKAVEPLAHSNLLTTPTPPRSPSSSQSSDAKLSEPLQRDALAPSTHRSSREEVEDRKSKSTSVPQPGDKTDLKAITKSIQPSGKDESSRQLHKDRKDHEPGLSVSIDAASSPSSTAGAYSNSTPKPAQHSPDTSPDGEVYASHQLERTERDLEGATSPKNSRENGNPRRNARSQNADLDVMPSAVNALSQSSAHSTQQAINPNDGAADVVPPGVLRDGSANVDKNAPVVGKGNELPSRIALDQDVEMKDVDLETSRLDHSLQLASPTEARTSPLDPTPQRMTTRVASGAIRQKSVTELLGGTPRSAHPDRGSISSQVLVSASKGSMRSTPGTPIEDRSKMSMVVFSKREKSRSPKSGDSEEDGYLALRGAAEDLEKDYMRPLFLQQAYQPPRANPLNDLVASANKTITTSNIRAMLKERTDYNILRRIYTMQNANKWSLRQMKKFPDPPQAPSHWDHLLTEMKWMRTDFREERKWKMAMARNLAEWCALYVAASEDDKQHFKVKTRPPRELDSQDPMVIDDTDNTPPLVHSGVTESDYSSVEEVPRLPTVAPTALFSLGYDDFLFQLDPTPVAEDVLAELPMFESKFEPLQSRENMFVPASKFATGKILPKPATTPAKRSRYEYEEEDYELSVVPPAKRRASEVSLFLSPARRSPRIKELAPEESDVALFNPIHRHMRERLRANGAFRPPSEFVMPQTSFFEHRVPSQWTWDEDQRLRGCVRKYSYNWSLISMEMQQFTQPSMMVAGTERRTPWECFERWVQLEGLPNDMGKTQYFRTYQNRLELANKLVAEKRPQQMQQIQTPGQPAQTRARGTQPFRVERRREARYVTMIDAIRKLARKRETHLHRQQESAKAAALRKQQQQDSQQPRSTIHTPAEFSRMKYERELKIQERQEQYRQQVMQQQRVRPKSSSAGVLDWDIYYRNAYLQTLQIQQSANQVQRAQAIQAASLANRQTQNGTPNSASGPSPPNASMGAPNQQQNPSSAGGNMNPPRPSSSQSQLPNGLATTTGAAMAGMQPAMPAAQIQALLQQQTMQNQQRLPNQQNTEAIRLAMQRQAMIQQQQQQQGLLQNAGMGGHNSNLAAAHLSPANAAMQNPQMLAALAAVQRQNQGHMNGIGNNMGAGGNQTSPRVNHVGVAGGNGQLSSGHTPTINTIMNQVHQQNPGLPIDQIRLIAQDRLKGYLARMQQQAAAAAAGNSPIGNGMAGMNMMGNMMGNMGGMGNMGMMNGLAMNGLAGMANMPAMAGGTALSPQQQQYQAQLQRQLAAQQQQQQQQRLSASAAAAAANIAAMSPALGQAQPGLSRSATPAQQGTQMHNRSGSAAAVDLGTGSPLLQ